jgi:hypothetical protein
MPARGDLIWVQFSPHAGHEQAGHRPAVVISPSSYFNVQHLDMPLRPERVWQAMHAGRA